MKLYLTEEEILFYEKTKNDIVKEVDDGLKITLEDYIHRIQKYSDFNFHKKNREEEEKNRENEEIDNEFGKEILEKEKSNFLDIFNDDEKGNFFIYEYKRIRELQTGEMFGDLALSSNKTKRTATVITAEECHFACLTREIYEGFVEEGNERIRINKVNYLSNINILKYFPRFILEKRLFNNFAFINFQKEKYVLKTDEINNNIIFLKDGIFEVSFVGKINDLNDLINSYYHQYMNLLKKKDHEENEEDLMKNIKKINSQKQKIESLFQKDINEEFSYILFLVNAPSIFGFRPTEKRRTKFIINNKENTTETINIYYSYFCVKCYSNKGEYIYIDKNTFYKQIYGMDGLVQEETKIYTIDFFRKTLKRLLHIRYIKIWNLLLTNGVDKHFNINLDWEKIENTEDIYNAVDKLLDILNEGQLYYNEMSKYINDYFEKKKLIIQSQKHQIKLISQNYQSEKMKKLLISKSNNKDRLLRNFENTKTNNKMSFNSINENILNSINLNNITMKNKFNKGKRRSMEEKYKKIVKKILNMSQENLSNKDQIFKKKLRTRNSNRSISASTIFKNNSLFVSKEGKNITINNYLLHLNKEKSFPQENLTIVSTTNSPKNCNNNNDLKKILEYSSNNNKNIKQENKNFKRKLNLKKYNNYQNISNRPSVAESMINLKNCFDLSKKSKEKYVNNRVRYIIKNTRLFFTKTQNLDKIVRKRRNLST